MKWSVLGREMKKKIVRDALKIIGLISFYNVMCDKCHFPKPFFLSLFILDMAECYIHPKYVFILMQNLAFIQYECCERQSESERDIEGEFYKKISKVSKVFHSIFI